MFLFLPLLYFALLLHLNYQYLIVLHLFIIEAFIF